MKDKNYKNLPPSKLDFHKVWKIQVKILQNPPTFFVIVLYCIVYVYTEKMFTIEIEEGLEAV